jgi:hypothetical protein
MPGFFHFCGEEFFVGEEHLVFAGAVEAEVDLAGIGVGELAECAFGFSDWRMGNPQWRCGHCEEGKTLIAANQVLVSGWLRLGHGFDGF